MKVKFLDPYGFDDNSNFSSLENEVRAAHEDLDVKTDQNAQGVANNASNLATSVKNLAANLTNVQNNLYDNITGVQTSLDSKIETVRATADTSYGNAKYNRELIDSINNQKIPQLATKVDDKQDKSDFQSYTAATEEKIGSKADKNHTHTLKDITDYVAPKLSLYALTTDVDAKVAESEKVINEGISELKNTYASDKVTFGNEIKALQDEVAKLQKTVSKLTGTSNPSN